MLDLLVVAAIGMISLAVFNLISLRITLSKENRRRVLEKSKAQEEKTENIIEFGRLKADMIRYQQNRKAFFGMKMDYLPTKEKIDKLLKKLQIEMSKTKNGQSKQLAGIDIDILEEMRVKLLLGTLVVLEFPVKSEGEKARSVSDSMPMWIMLIGSISFSVPGLLLGLGILLLSPFLQSEYVLSVSADALVLSLSAYYSVLLAENVLRRSRKRVMRMTAHFSQVAAAAIMLIVIILLALQLII